MSAKKRNITHINQNDEPLKKRMKLCLYWAGYKKGRDRQGKPIDNNNHYNRDDSNCLFDDYNCKNRHYLIGDERKANQSPSHQHHHLHHHHHNNEIIIKPIDNNNHYSQDNKQINTSNFNNNNHIQSILDGNNNNHNNQHTNKNNNIDDLTQTLLDYQLYDDSTFTKRNNQFHYRISNTKGTCEIMIKNGQFNDNIICSVSQEIVKNMQFDIGNKFKSNTTKINQYHDELQNDISKLSIVCNGIKDLTTNTKYDKKVIYFKLQQIEKQLHRMQKNISYKNDVIKRCNLQINELSINRD